ncbi:MAG: TIGR02678 family protein [Lachnospiraceae bacterium]|nr:TIGR02678 family protein [Lachnospiraceae bacterium]
MEAVRTLMEKYWINKGKEKELYQKTRREMNRYRRFFTEHLGWNLINNERVLKLEKLPAHAESFMGITAFTEIRDYCIFCALLIFLEDKEDGEQFLLSELVAMVEAQLQESLEIDWTMFHQRKSLVRALHFAEERGLLEVYEGSSENVANGMEHEVLYENTGLSRYFAVNFGYSISNFKSWRDFEKEQMKELETDRGHVRTHRVYRQLASAPGMYWDSSENADSIYLKNQRQWIGKYLGEYLGGSLHIHKNAAFFVVEEENRFGEVHPRENAVSEVCLNVCAELRERIIDQEVKRRADDCVEISREQFREVLSACKEECQKAWSKEFREMTLLKLEDVIVAYMKSWMMAKETEEEILLYPAVGKLTGVYPREFLEREETYE